MTFVLCGLLGLMLLLYAGHAAHHSHAHPHDHHHIHQECTVCRVMDGWFSLLKGAVSAGASSWIPLAIVLMSLFLGGSSFALRQDVTPVTLKVKMTS
jgi:hypothetical protein